MAKAYRCFDTLRGDRCELRTGHEGAHVNGSHRWDFRDIPVAPWRKNLTARDNTCAMLTGGPL